MPVEYQPRAVPVLGLRHRSCAHWHGARISEFDKAMIVAKLKGARDRPRRARGKCEGRKAYAGARRWARANRGGAEIARQSERPASVPSQDGCPSGRAWLRHAQRSALFSFRNRLDAWGEVAAGPLAPFIRLFSPASRRSWWRAPRARWPRDGHGPKLGVRCCTLAPRWSRRKGVLPPGSPGGPHEPTSPAPHREPAARSQAIAGCTLSALLRIV
jgi:hypothetical protein